MDWVDAHGLRPRLLLPNKGEAPEPLSPARLPLVICGPVLRRTEPDAVTVWVALKKARTVTLRVYSVAPPPFPTSLREELQGTRETVRFGEHLHIVAVTARPVEAGRVLEPGSYYFYNLFFGPAGGATVPESGDDLNKDDIVFIDDAVEFGDPNPTGLSYSDEHHLPSFSLPPADLNKLRIIHGTCRKPDGPGRDALPALDKIISDTWPTADERPHLLLLNGDQIYADDVADPVLFLLMNADFALLRWVEPLPGVGLDDERLWPGDRKEIVRGLAQLTTEDPEGHVLRLGEYLAMYLFSWSGALWPLEFPKYEEVCTKPLPTDETFHNLTLKKYQALIAELDEFRKRLRQVRRALANVPVFMMFDDHDVTDDWNMLRVWCERIYANRLARRIVQNALLAYAVCQSWGNTPERFEPGQTGAALLASAAAWAQAQGNDAASEQEIARRVGIPGTLSADDQLTGLFTQVGDFFILSRAADALRWDYVIRGPQHEILMLDSRTRREFPVADGSAIPSHLGPAALAEQLPPEELAPDKLSIVVATTNVITVPVFHGTEIFGDRARNAWWYVVSRIIQGLLSLELLQRLLGFSLFNPDLRDSWKPQTHPFESLLSRLARRAAVVGGKRASSTLFLSGDVHFSWAARMQYWADRPFEAPAAASEPLEAIFAHLTSSAFKKEDKELGLRFHKWGYIPMADTLPGEIRWFGWRSLAELADLTDEEMAGIVDAQYYEPWMSREPPMVAFTDAAESQAVPFVNLPDWRYRIDFVLGEKSGINFTLGLLEKPNPDDHDNWLKVFSAAHERYRNYAQKWGDGIEIIGRNNIAELRFQWGGQTTLVSAVAASDASFTVAEPDALPAPPVLVKLGDEVVRVGAIHRGTGVCSDVRRAQHKTQAAAHAAGAAVGVFRTATQTHWWRLTGDTQLVPLTRYTVSLDRLDPVYPKPMLRQEVQP
ncbi:MAG TPA: hypothetical protein VN256_04225 [Pyrinomonadaceae bacterium]|nr:hypothetical protein [Pyrinomonadaceae bacterium]